MTQQKSKQEFDFDKYFPVLMGEMKGLKKSTDYDKIEIMIQRGERIAEGASDIFYDVKMIELVKRVDEELISVLG